MAVAVLIGIVWYLAGRTSRSSAGQDPAPVANTSAAPTMTGVLANSTGPSRSTVPSPSPSPPVAGSPSATGSATDAAPPATDSAAPTDPAAATAQPPADAALPTDAAPPASTAPATDGASAPVEAPAPAPAPPSYDAEGKLLCPDAAIALAAQAPAEVKSGTNVIVGMTVTNAGAETCRREVSGTLQVFTVFGADGTRLWSTADCFPGQGADSRDLTPGQKLEYTIKWSGTTSAPGCSGERTPLAPGTYTLIAQLGGLSSPPASFNVV